MKRPPKFGWILMVFGLAFLTWGCEDGECLLSSDCDDGYVCQRGACLITCSEDNPCPDGHACTDGFCQADDDSMGGMSAAGGTMGGAETPAPGAGSEADEMTPEDMAIMNNPTTAPVAGAEPNSMAMPTPEPSAQDASIGAGGASVQSSNVASGGASNEGVTPSGSDDDEEEGSSSLFDLSGTYSVVSTVITATGGPLEEDEQEQVLIRLTKLDGFRYRLEEYDLARVERTNVASSVSFAAPEGPGHYQFEYSILAAASGEGTQRSCNELETRFQRGAVRPSRGNRFELTGTETREISYEGEMCSAGGWDTFLTTQWFPVPD